MFNEFKPTSKSEWLDKVVKDTKGKKQLEDFNWQLDDLIVSPFHHRDDADNLLPNLRTKSGNQWEIGTTILCRDANLANQEIQAALAAGAQAICLVFETTPNKKELAVTLEGVQHEWISSHFRASAAAYPMLIDDFLNILRDKNQDPAKVHCSFASTDQDKHLPIDLLSYQSAFPLASFRTIKVAKSNIVKDLAEALVTINQYLLDLAEKGEGLTTNLPIIQCTVPLEDAYFPFLAKVRALKVLTQQIIKAWHIKMPPPRIMAELDAATLTENENYNRIKMTSQAMSAVTAGVDTLFLATPNSEDTDFSRRIALNIQHLLQQESFLDRVADPAAGSYFIDQLTKQIAEEAWSLFQQISAQS